MTQILSKEDAISLLKKYNVSQGVLDHVMAVHDYAMEIASNIDCDTRLVEAGSLLHDIGRSRSHNIDHAIIGAEILRKEGVDERIVSIVEKHVGAGLTPHEAEKLGLPPADYVPRTIEEKIVCHADNLIGNTERISIKDAIKIAREKWFDTSTERLIQFHFEVFRPVNVVLRERIYADTDRVLNAIGLLLDRLLKYYDVLFKVRTEGSRCIVSLYGHDAKPAGNYLSLRIGIPEHVEVGNAYTAYIKSIDNDDVIVELDRDYRVSRSELNAALGPGGPTDIASRYGLVKNMPVGIIVTGDGTAQLTEEQTQVLKKWAGDTVDRIIVSGVTRAHLKQIIKKSDHYRDIKDVERLSILCQMIICRQGVDGIGLASILSRRLPVEMKVITGHGKR